ncbi:sigma-70 family RNA polymerase sigma factor [Paenalkalicoccus suaedae]|uniref:Sigma-70 family RNA polymerase sigma factor n=1 Tax=Paenalkalicoccus suaedae TaxID=2592382 RepID=A0A859FAU8_9BACI|nr:sigma-70 family RNA polymerase sigma factor [Paenalkalicoccus suaedae]QKS69908.1 sigma-70 family RNA polymerase sigma factor [Paenalkalicoccus suaedae]
MHDTTQHAFSYDDKTIEHDKDVLLDHMMHQYGDGILHLAYTYVKNEATAEDLTQEIFVKSYQKLHQFKQQSSLKTWLYRIASNHCKDYVKSFHHRKMIVHDKLFDALPSATKQVEETVIQTSEEHTLANAVMHLPLKYREVIHMHYYEDMSLAEIHDVTSVNINTLKTRLKRAKDLLKQHMTNEEV